MKSKTMLRFLFLMNLHPIAYPHYYKNASSSKVDENEEWIGLYIKFLNWGSSDIDYTSYHSAIVQLSLQTELNIALIVDTSCVKDDIIKLTSKLKMVRKTAFCYQMDSRSNPWTIRFLLASKASLTVFFQPWYVSLGLLEKMKYYGVTNMVFITIEIKPLHLQILQVEDIFLNVFNLRSTEPARMMLEDAKSIHSKKMLSNPKFCSFMKHDLPKKQKAIISACDENPVKVIRVVTKFDIFVQSVPRHVIKNDECEIGLPCRVPTKPWYGNKTVWHRQCCSGAFIDVLDKVIKRMKVSLDLYIVEDGTYNGLIYDVHMGKADIALQQLTPSAERAELVDFTPAVISTPDYMTLVVRKGSIFNRVLDWSSLQHMTSMSLIGLVVTTFLILLVIFILENVGYVHEFNRRYSFCQSFSFVNGLLFQRDIGGTLPRRWPGQIVSFLFAFGMLVVVSAFTAQLTATNIVDVEDDFQGLKDKVFQDPTYKFGLLGNSYMDHWINRSNLKAKIFKIQDVTEAFDRLINKSIDAYGSFAIIVEHEMSTKTHYKNELRLHNEDGSENVVAFAYSKKSKIGIKLSCLILQLRESGELQKIYKVWGVRRTTDIIAPIPYSKPNKLNYARYPIEYGLPLALVLGCSCVLCAVLLLVECCVFYLRANRKYTVSGKASSRSTKISAIYRHSEQLQYE